MGLLPSNNGGEIGLLLICGAHELPLRQGEAYLVGRNPDCQLVLDDRTVSRRHARFVVGESVVIEDLGSANGVFVDGVRVDGASVVDAGQRVQVGSFELVLFDGTSYMRRRSSAAHGRASAPTLTDLSSQRAAAVAAAADDPVSYFDVLAELSDKLLSRDRIDEAERLISGSLEGLLEQARNRAAIDPEVSERAAWHALRLAEATGRREWFEYVFELYSALDALLPEPVLNESYRIVHAIRRPSFDVLNAYALRMEQAGSAFGPSERFRIRRLSGLARMLSSR